MSEKKILSRRNAVELCKAVAKGVCQKMGTRDALGVMLPIYGVCGSRADMPEYGVWAFPDEGQGGVWTVDGSFDEFGLTREDYCDRLGIDRSIWAPKADVVFRSLPTESAVRLYTAEVGGNYVLRAMSREGDGPSHHVVELMSSHFDAEGLGFPTTLEWSHAELDENIKVGDTVQFKCDFLQQSGLLPLGAWCPWVVTGKYYADEDQSEVQLLGLVPSLDQLYKVEMFRLDVAPYPQAAHRVWAVFTLVMEW